VLEESEYFGLLAPELGVEVEADEFDGFDEALARRNRPAGFSGVAAVGWIERVVCGRVASIRHVGPFGGLRVPARLPVVFGRLVSWF